MNNNLPKDNVFDTSFVAPEDVFLSSDRTQISIIHTNKLFDYSLYNTENTKQHNGLTENRDWLYLLI